MPPLHPEELTVAQLQRELKKGRVKFPFKAKKDVYIDLYRRHILKAGMGFSSEEDEPIPRWSATARYSNQTPPRRGAYKIIYQDKLSDVEDMTDRQLRAELRRRNVSAGPIVGSTRLVYERKLAKMMSEEVQHGPTRTQSTMVSFHDEEESDEEVEEEEEVPDSEEEEEEKFSDSDLEEEKLISGEGDNSLRRSRRQQALSNSQSTVRQSSSSYSSSRSQAYRTKQPSRRTYWCGFPLWFWWLAILAGMAFFIYLIWANMETSSRPELGDADSSPRMV